MEIALLGGGNGSVAAAVDPLLITVLDPIEARSAVVAAVVGVVYIPVIADLTSVDIDHPVTTEGYVAGVSTKVRIDLVAVITGFNARINQTVTAGRLLTI